MSPELLVTAAAGLLFGMVLFKLSALKGRLDRLARLEGKVDALLGNLGVTYDPRAGVPEEVVSLALAGRTIDAVKRYRELTGVGLKDAKDVVDDVKRRAGP